MTYTLIISILMLTSDAPPVVHHVPGIVDEQTCREAGTALRREWREASMRSGMHMNHVVREARDEAMMTTCVKAISAGRR